MEQNTAEITSQYINEHPYIKHCLKKGLINYSALARHIAKELDIGKKSSKEAILVAARRKHESLKGEIRQEKEIRRLLSDSEMEIKNRMAVFILDKGADFDSLKMMQAKAKKESGLSYALEGSGNYTVIIQEKYSRLVEKGMRHHIIKANRNMALIIIKSPKEIEGLPGVVAYLASLFAENGVNIYEFLSCWTDTIFIISQSDISRAVNFLSFA